MAAKKEKAGFGSFNSGNVEQMLRDPNWQPPPRPAFLQALNLPQEGCVSDSNLGRAAKTEHFLLSEAWTFVNHGAFGSPLAAAFAAAEKWRRHAELQPLEFIDRQLFPYLVKVTKELARFVSCEATDLVLVPNATTGLNAVLRSVPLKPGDSVFFLDCTYNSVKKMITQRCEEVSAHAVEAPLRLSTLTSPQDIVDAVVAALPDNCFLAVFDHVTSNSALLLPIADLIRECQSRGILVLIDGAHGLGACELDLSALGAEYYVGNCHKWFCAPRGVGFLFVNHARLAEITPPDQASQAQTVAVTSCSEVACERVGTITLLQWGAVHAPLISHGHLQGFASEFVWDGARDYSPVLALEICILFWRAFPLPRAREYAARTLREGIAFLSRSAEAGAERAGVCSGAFLPSSLQCPTMALVGLPARPDGVAARAEDASALQDALYKAGVECPVKVLEGRLYLRVSAWIHNDPQDFVELDTALHAVLPALSGA
mmetsp:Transcript_62469/g.149416  ORF Transcript_62469/g.149416 Transcript_62469/m.149416 type:complete len:487 (-) Transcript_62469:57-1517(-)